jgi:hypothetical protein
MRSELRTRAARGQDWSIEIRKGGSCGRFYWTPQTGMHAHQSGAPYLGAAAAGRFRGAGDRADQPRRAARLGPVHVTAYVLRFVQRYGT